uniref:Uncharacterized protein n=1 Tax=Oryza meridionalis TaxID=40149 RepID=A0A0E0D3E3_9ORYZ
MWDYLTIYPFTHIGVPQPFIAPSSFSHGTAVHRPFIVSPQSLKYTAPQAPMVHQAFTHFVPRARDDELARL